MTDLRPEETTGSWVMPAARHRDPAIDAIRGAAIVLMVADHGLGFAQTTDLDAPWMELVRHTVTRFSMPGFMLCSGILLARASVSRRRWCEAAGGALAVNAAATVTGMGGFVPDILATWCAVMLLAGIVRRWPATVAVLGLLQSTYWTVPIVGYQPGWVAAFVALGVLVERAGDREVLMPIARRMPDWMVSIGRRPLMWYLGHLALLAAVTLAGTHIGWW